MKKIYVLALAAVGVLLLIASSSWGKLHIATCGKHSAHSATRCHVPHHNNLYGLTLRGNIYGQAVSESAIYFPGGSYYGTDPDPRIVFELHRDPGFMRNSGLSVR
jgi:hypothetical protein